MDTTATTTSRLDRLDGLRVSHSRDAISARLNQATPHVYLQDFVFGAVDGIVTTFAVVAGVAGAGLAPRVALALGVANLLADGLSMATSNYLGSKTEVARLAKLRRMEEEHVAKVPEGEREEVRQIFSGKGFEGALLDQIVDVITADRQRWVNTMLVEEHGVRLTPPSPVRASLTTFMAFVAAGSLPLLPLVASYPHFPLTCAMAGVAFLLTGWVKGAALGRGRFASALETLLLGGAAATVAYFVGTLFR